MISITAHEYTIMMRYREALDLFCDNGTWAEGGHAFIIDEATTNRILELIDEDCEAEDD